MIQLTIMLYTHTQMHSLSCIHSMQYAAVRRTQFVLWFDLNEDVYISVSACINIQFVCVILSSLLGFVLASLADANLLGMH